MLIIPAGINFENLQILKPKTAILLIDIQNDFITGSLSLSACPAKQDGAEVVPVANHLLDIVSFDVIVYSIDWHPVNHISFIDCVHDREMHTSSKVNICTVLEIKESFELFISIIL